MVLNSKTLILYPRGVSVFTFSLCVRHSKLCVLQVDSEKSEASAIKRENQALVESCDAVEKARQKATHDLGVKVQQVSNLEGQLSTSKKTIERLEQELKK